MKSENFAVSPYHVERGYHVPKLTLLEVWPLHPFIGNRRDLTVLDVGGNIGLWCQAWMGTFGSLTRAYHIFEPLSGNYMQLRRRLANAYVPHHENVFAYNCCIGPHDGEIVINTHSDVSATASIVVKEMRVGTQLIQNSLERICPMIAIDSFVRDTGLAKIDLIKIDVEGYEWEVLQGAQNSIADGKIGAVYFEFGQHQGEVGQTFKQFWDLLRGYGYHLYRNAHIRNFFGLQEIETYHPSLEDFSSVWMVLASREPHNPNLNKPHVISRYRPPAP